MAELKEGEVLLSDNRVAKKVRAKVKDLANAENQPKNKEYLIKYALFACQIHIDGKPIVLEDLLELYADDLEKIASLFTEEEQKNA